MSLGLERECVRGGERVVHRSRILFQCRSSPATNTTIATLPKTLNHVSHPVFPTTQIRKSLHKPHNPAPADFSFLPQTNLLPHHNHYHSTHPRPAHNLRLNSFTNTSGSPNDRVHEKLKKVEENLWSFFFTNFPENWMEKDMRSIFESVGEVNDVFIPNRKDRWGKRFGFVKFRKNCEEAAILQKLNAIWIGSYKIRANISRPTRDTGNRNYKNSDYRIMQNVQSLRTNRSFRDVVTQQTNRVIQNCVKIDTSSNNYAWFEKSRVGVLKRYQDWRKAQEEIKLSGYPSAYLTPLGGTKVLIRFKEEQEFETFLSEEKEWWCAWFDQISIWQPWMAAPVLTKWIKVVGVPLFAWNLECFKTIGSFFGDVVKIDQDTINKEILDAGRVCVITQNIDIIAQKKWIQIDDQFFEIMVIEDGNNPNQKHPGLIQTWKEESDSDDFGVSETRWSEESSETIVADSLELVEKINALEAADKDLINIVNSNNQMEDKVGGEALKMEGPSNRVIKLNKEHEMRDSSCDKEINDHDPRDKLDPITSHYTKNNECGLPLGISCSVKNYENLKNAGDKIQNTAPTLVERASPKHQVQKSKQERRKQKKINISKKFSTIKTISKKERANIEKKKFKELVEDLALDDEGNRTMGGNRKHIREEDQSTDEMSSNMQTNSSNFSITDSAVERCNNRVHRLNSVEEECKEQWECGKGLGIDTKGNEEEIVKEFINFEHRDREAKIRS